MSGSNLNQSDSTSMFSDVKGKRRVCSRCASIKQACDGNSPCGRCVRLSLPCGDQGASTALSKDAPSIKRVHTGCGPCKKRKRKCDEARPRCRSCVRLCPECVWPQEWRKARRVHVSSSRASSPAMTGASVIGASTPGADSSDEHSLNSSSRSVAGSTSSCACHGDDILTLSVPRSPSMVPQLTSDRESGLLGHFINTTAAYLTRAKSAKTNPYLKHLLPLAFADRSVMDAILALSASQQERRQGTFAALTLRYQSRAAKSLGESLSSFEQHSSIIALATSLVLCMTELYGGSTDGWKQHLHGAKQILDIAKRVDCDGFHFLKSVYCFLDSATTISTCRPPLTERFHRGDDDEDSGLEVYGIRKPLFHLLDRVNSLAYQRRTRVDDGSERAFRHAAQNVLEAIDLQIIPYSERETDSVHASSAFRWAMRLRLAQIVDGYDTSNPEIAHALENILREAQQVPGTSHSQATLLFPLIMAAGACVKDDDRDYIRSRLIAMKQESGFGHVHSAHDLAERVWMYRDMDPYLSSPSPVNWAHIRYYEMHGLAIF